MDGNEKPSRASRYYHKHRDMCLEWKREYYKRNRDELLAKQKAYYEAHRDEILRKARERAKRRKEAVAE